MNESTGNNGQTVTEGNLGERELADLRAELDTIDNRLLEDVRARIEVCTRIAYLKERHAIPVMQPRRVGAVHDHAHRYALDHGLSPQFLHDLYDLLISETCRVEDRIVETAELRTHGAPVEHAGRDRVPARRTAADGATDTSVG
ncbi:chorismate mutase family protein [Gordonia rubripertincta]|uniref:Chorismate mutase family protein n=1 Tax=Gordonia rubripertincta TaxID=36822 RepID=A0AAW4G7X7_GORRU|nr:chorismate mutase family protein [Gordonia rubripertincta]MBM7279235.1 chorismate mutase family protein [Gordonia rubripertincta]